jgi:hypothetical protein
MSLLSDLTFQYITIILVAILTLAVGILAYLRRHTSKSLSFKIVNIIPMLSFRKEIRDKIKVTYEGNDVEDVTVFLLGFVNTGNVPVVPSDFIKPFSISFAKDVKVLTAELFESKPANMGLDLTSSPDTVTIKPLLINPKDSFTIKILTTKSFTEFGTDFRIIGVNEIKQIKPKLTEPNLFFMAYVTFMALLFVSLVGYNSTKNDAFIVLGGISLLVLIASFVYVGLWVVVSIVRRYLLKRKQKICLA